MRITLNSLFLSSCNVASSQIFLLKGIYILRLIYQQFCILDNLKYQKRKKIKRIVLYTYKNSYRKLSLKGHPSNSKENESTRLH